MLGSRAEAEDAVQEAWLRLARADVTGIGNMSGWLTTVVARVCLDMLRSRKSRREEPMAPDHADGVADADAGRDVEMADSVGLAMLVVLETLAPAERVAFVLHDMFELPFDDIANILERSPDATRQLASRARRRVRGASTTGGTDRARQVEVVNAFLAASRGGDFAALLAVLDPDVVLRADAAAVAASLARAGEGAPVLAAEVHGAEAVAATFKGRAQAARLAMVDGSAGLVFAPGGTPRVVFEFLVQDGRIVELSLIADAQSIAARDVQF
jgi:RNA polymerase sigma-70 factor (ECF subfamily)